MRRHLLITNDFPPKVGGIQSYLWELWRRLPSSDVSIYTTPYSGDDKFDAGQDFPIQRSSVPWLLPNRWLVNRMDRLAAAHAAELAIWDPAIPLGLAAPKTSIPYGVILHGAEITIPARLPILRAGLAALLQKASLVISAGGYPAFEAERIVDCDLPILLVPPGVDTDRFKPLGLNERSLIRQQFGFPEDAQLVVSVSRLVPRKGMDVLIQAAAKLSKKNPDLLVAIAGVGRDRDRLLSLIASTDAPVRLIGRISDDHLSGFYGMGDIFAMLCRTRLNGLEQEGFGIVFLEAAASGVPQIAGRSGGSAEAVEHGKTGFVIDDPCDIGVVASALQELLDNESMRQSFAEAGRRRAIEDFSYEFLSQQLRVGIDGVSL